VTEGENMTDRAITEAATEPNGKSNAGARPTGALRLLFRIVLQRLALGAFSLFAISLIIFTSVEMLPGSYASAVLGQSATKETVAAFERELGLDRPAVERYVTWVSGATQGDFGVSFTSRGDAKRYVTEMIAPRLFNTLFLAGFAALIAVPLAILLGIGSAFWRNGWLDRVLNGTTLTLVSSPEFFLAYILTYCVIMRDTFNLTPLGQLMPDWMSTAVGAVFHLIPNVPVLSNVTADMALGDRLWACILPALTLVLVTLAHMMRMTRAAIINLLASPYVEMAQLKGVHPFLVILRHALPNAWGPIAYVISVNLAYLITGAVVVEVVFVYPGAGQLLVDSVRSRDIPVVQACALIFAGTYILLNLLTDLVAIFTNPKLVHPK
jgi:peptide/nickel transport system permease protein